MNRKFKFSIGEFYHIYNRGNNKSIIFLDEKDNKRFQKLLYVCNGKKPVVFKLIQGLTLDKIDRGETLVDIGAYCPMPNHFHLLVKEKIEGGTSLFLGKLSTAYSMYFNKKYERTGAIFEGTFQAKHIQKDEYLQYLFAYIHLNPIKIIDPEWKDKGIADMKKAKEYLMNYKYSSYLDYIGVSREESVILNKSAFPEYFEDFKEFEKFVDGWLDFKNSY